MLRSPEQNYPAIGGSHDWMREQLETQISERFGPRFGGGSVLDRAVANLAGPAPQGPNWSYTLVTDRTTEAEATSAPQILSEFDRRPYRQPVSYQIVVTDHRTGRSDLVRDPRQRPQRFSFDPAEPQRRAREEFGETRGALDEMFPMTDAPSLL